MSIVSRAYRDGRDEPGHDVVGTTGTTMESHQSEELEFINTDLDVYWRERPEALLAWLEKHSILVSSCDGRTTFELNNQPRSISESLRGLSKLLDHMPVGIRELWVGCERRSFDIGMRRRQGSGIAQLGVAISTEDLRLIAELHGEIAFTIYPED